MMARGNRTRGSASRHRRIALAAGVALAMAGCAPTFVTIATPTGSEKYKDGGGPNPRDPYTFTIVENDKGCPVDATMDGEFQNCPDHSKSCVRVRPGQTVRFQSPSNDFFLLFDPFDPPKTRIDSDGKVLDLKARRNATPGKPYTFIVGREKPECSATFADPQIIPD